ncbi:MAG: hypothetical protein EOM20_17695 [Spartobacteria bacterium]|nr:hypothetical protein [Spartobacteria bacterium]
MKFYNVFFCLALSAVFASVCLGQDAAPKANLPLIVYGNCEDEVEPPYIPSGWMGNAEAITRDDCWPTDPHSGQSCIKITYNESGKWAGIVWQNPADDWGDEPGGFDLTGAKKLTFWARGEEGNEIIEVKFGLLGRNKAYHDSGKGSAGRIKLTSDWKQYEIPLEGKNLSCIKTGFAWSLAGRKDPITFYLDDIRYE